jgi:Sulfotransferase family
MRISRAHDSPVQLPDFLLVGAAKSGSTSLNASLTSHPDVFMCRQRGTRFFAFDDAPPRFHAPAGGELLANGNPAISDLESYAALFKAARSDQLLGESCNHYLYEAGAARRIRHHVPGAKIIAILRDPVDRAYSNFLHLRRDGLEPARSFREALALEPSRIRDSWGMMWRYTDLGMYGSQLERYLAEFPRQQILVLLYEDLRRDPRGTLREVAEFLGMRPFTAGRAPAYNPSGTPRSDLLNALVNRDNPLRRTVARRLPLRVKLQLNAFVNRRNLKRVRMEPEMRALLKEKFDADTRRLEQLLGRDLSSWRKS